MNFFKVCGAGLLAAVAAGCWSHDTGGTAVTPDAVAGLRYVNLVSDTAALNFRVVDVINNAPNSINAVFRTGGNPYGVTTVFLPMHMPVDAGTRHIKVFMYSTIDTIASKVVLDTTYTFAQNVNYTFYLFGYARGGPPKVTALITVDTITNIPAGQFAIRVVNLAPTLGPTFATAGADVYLDTLPAANTPAGAPTFANVGFLEVRPYTLMAAARATAPAQYYRGVIAAPTTTAPFLTARADTGVVGTSIANPIGGSRVAGTAMTAIIAPSSVVGSGAPQSAAYTTPTVLYIIDKRPPQTAP